MNWEVPRRCALLLLGALSSGCCTGGDALSIAAVELTLLDPITGGNVCDAVVVAEDWVRRPRPPVGADMKRTARSALWVCAALAILLAVWVYSRLPAAGDVRPTGVPVPASTVRLVPAPSPAQATPQMDIVPHTGNAAADVADRSKASAASFMDISVTDERNSAGWGPSCRSAQSRRTRG